MLTYVLLFMIGVAIACHIAISRDKKNTKVFEKNKVKYRDGDNT